MKKLLIPAIALCLSGNAAFAGNWFGSGPWANATYYPGNLDGKYQAAVFGANVSGVLGFAIRDGAPPFLQSQSQTLASLNSGGSNNAIVSNQQIGIDNSLNYYAIFVNGRTYVGTTAAAINYDNDSVNGTLIGTQPSTITTTNQIVVSQLITNIVSTNETFSITTGGSTLTTNIVYDLTNIQTVLTTNAAINAAVISTGVDGAFQANINSKRAVFTFQGPGQLSAPGPVTNGTQVNPSLAFNVNGIRVSFSSTANFQSLTPSTGTAAPQ
jgi:hypothetical protein